MMINTPRLHLQPTTPELLRAELAGRSEFAAAIGMDVPTSWPPEFYDEDAIRQTLAALEDNASPHPWGLYYVVLRETATSPATLVGTAGFKGPPGADGSVEIGYSIVVEHQRRGLATEAVRALVEFAFDMPAIQTVVGQTLPHLIASRGVLRKLGFAFVGGGEDPHAPPGAEVLRYELRRCSDR
jgi:RimJ/RimL family protein N-acetyltransferase